MSWSFPSPAGPSLPFRVVGGFPWSQERYDRTDELGNLNLREGKASSVLEQCVAAMQLVRTGLCAGSCMAAVPALLSQDVPCKAPIPVLPRGPIPAAHTPAPPAALEAVLATELLPVSVLSWPAPIGVPAMTGSVTPGVNPNPSPCVVRGRKPLSAWNAVITCFSLWR